MGASLLTALLARLTIPLPVVPITGQTLVALLIGASPGSKKGSLAMYAAALPWLSFYVPGDRVLSVGLIPFVAGDLVKLVVAATLLPAAWKLLGRDR